MEEKPSLVGLVVFVLLTMALLLVFFYTPKLLGFAVGTSVEINEPPEFNHSKPIANQSFDAGTTLSDVFDLDDHFSDPNGDTLTYEVFGNSSVTVSIATSNVVSYSAPSSFSGSEILRFYGDDGHNRNASSNNVTITVNEVAAAPVAGPGGGGGGAGRVRESFIFDKEELKVRLRQGQTKKKSFKIINDGARSLEIVVDFSQLGEFFVPTDEIPKRIIRLVLGPGEERVIQPTFFAKDGTAPDVYLKGIIVRSKNLNKELPVIIEVSSRKILFDISVEILEEYKEILPGDKLRAKITIVKVGRVVKADVSVKMAVKDFAGNQILESSRIVTTESSAVFTEELTIPKEIALGRYILITTAAYGGKIAVASDTFDLTEKVTLGQLLLSFGATAAFILLLTIILAILLRRAARKRGHATEAESVRDLILEAQEYALAGDRSDALRIYRIIRSRFSKMPAESRKRILKHARALKEILS